MGWRMLFNPIFGYNIDGLSVGGNVILKRGIGEALKGREEIVAAYLYGSTVKGYAGGDSDIDVGLLLREDFSADALYPARVAREIEESCRIDREVDVRILNGRGFRFLYQVVRDGELIFSRDEGERVGFEMYVVSRYLDFKPYYDQYDEKRRERILE
jgi:hypothetical protein